MNIPRDDRLSGMLGMCEMENAVEFMLRYAEQAKQPLSYIIFHLGEFKDAGFNELLGFCHLLCRDLMQPRYPNSEFTVTQKLIDIMRNYNPRFANLPDAMSFDEWYLKRYPCFAKPSKEISL